MRATTAVLLSILVAAPALAAGFDFPTQSAKALAMGGTFVAQANDPTAVYYNPGGLGLLAKKKGASLGVTTSKFNESLYQGLGGIAAGQVAEQETPLATVPHVFGTIPFGAKIVTGVGVYSPFRMRTEWADPDVFFRRRSAYESELNSLDIATSAGIALGQSFGIGGSVIFRTTDFGASRNVTILDGNVLRDIATLTMKTDTEKSYTWSAGVLHRIGNSFSWGASYRAGHETDYNGVGKLTQIATGDTQLDELVRTQFTFDEDLALASTLSMPAQATFGIAIGSGQPFLLELDASQTDWKDVQEIAFAFPGNPELDTLYPLHFEDTLTYRAGLSFRFPTGPELRFGYALEESPQPDETVGAFLPDAARSTISAGFGLDWLNVGFAWTTYEQRIIDNSLDGMNGNFRQNAWTVAITATK
ncbi:MAG TPA: outer membrane protein transport protein [Thermoanaerobaculia bacterium]|nr:outer membrane protein transport protein [Thermoanaerobaculia bacterium]